MGCSIQKAEINYRREEYKKSMSASFSRKRRSSSWLSALNPFGVCTDDQDGLAASAKGGRATKVTVPRCNSC